MGLDRTEGRLPRSRHTVDQILATLREAEIALSHGQAVAPACRTLGVTEQTYYRWQNDYGGLTVDQVKRLKELDREQNRLKCTVADFTLDTVTLQEAAVDNCSAPRADGRRWGVRRCDAGLTHMAAGTTTVDMSIWIQGTKAIIIGNSTTSVMAKRDENFRRSGIWTASQDWSLADVVRLSTEFTFKPDPHWTCDQTLFLRPKPRRTANPLSCIIVA